jgi:hypothetical protein
VGFGLRPTLRRSQVTSAASEMTRSAISFAASVRCSAARRSAAAAARPGHASNRVDGELAPDADLSGELRPGSVADVCDMGGTVDAHRQSGHEVWVDDGADEVIQRCQRGGTRVIEQGIVLAVRVAVADQPVERQRVPEPRDLDDRCGRRLAKQGDRVADAGSAFGLVLERRRHAEGLTEVLLVQPADRVGRLVAVVALDHEIRQAGNRDLLPHLGDAQARRRGQGHAVPLVVDESREGLGLGLEDVGCRGCGVDRQRRTAGVEDDRQLGLCSGQ